jgi:hypothetical protein
LPPESAAILSACPDWLLCLDNDQAGDIAARRLTDRAPQKCRRLVLSAPAKDLTDFHVAGGSIRDWLRSEYTRFGWTPKATAPGESEA